MGPKERLNDTARSRVSFCDFTASFCDAVKWSSSKNDVQAPVAALTASMGVSPPCWGEPERTPHKRDFIALCVCTLVRWIAITVNFKSANFTCTCTNSTNSTVYLAVAVRRTMATIRTETTRGHWLEHHEHSSSSATLTKTETAR